MFSINIFMFIKITEPFQHPLITVEMLITLYLLLNKKTVQYTLKLAKNSYYDFERSNHHENKDFRYKLPLKQKLIKK